MLWLLITLFLLYPIPAFAQTQPNLQALVGGLIVRNPLWQAGQTSSLIFLNGTQGLEDRFTSAKITTSIKEMVQLNPTSPATTLQFWVNRKDYSLERPHPLQGSKLAPAFTIDENGSFFSEHGSDDFMWDNRPGILKLYTRSISLSEIDDPVDISIKRAGGKFPYQRGPLFDPNIPNQPAANIGQLEWQGFDGTDYRTVAKIYARAEGPLDSANSPGSIHLAVTPYGKVNEIEDKLVIRGNGRVGINTYTPQAQFHVQGDALASGTWGQVSDIRLKEDVQSLAEPLNKILGLKGISYKLKNGDNQRKIGVVAQEVEKIVPEVVSTGEDGYKSVAYQNLVPLLIEAIKQQNAEIQNLKKEVETLKK